MSLVSEQWAASRANPQRVFFIDSENGITGLIEGVQYLNSTDKVIVFHRDDIPQGTRARICKTPATVEWVACVDPKMKNSMDVQIIAELSAQLEADRFDSAYIVSNDKGYLPALHYLQKTPRGRGHALERISSIERVIVDSTFRFLETLRTAESVSELRYSLTVMLGEREANRILDRFGTLLTKKKAATEAPKPARPCNEPAAEAESMPSDPMADALAKTSAPAVATPMEPAASEPSGSTPARLLEPAASGPEPQDKAPAESEAENATRAAVGSPAPAAQRATVQGCGKPGWAASPASASGGAPSFRDVPGIGKALSAKLSNAGIGTFDQLRALGAVEAWKRVRSTDRSFPVKWAFAFDVAIRGIPVSSLGQERKKELKRLARGQGAA